MRIPKPKSAPGIFLWAITVAALALFFRIAWVVVGQSIEGVSTARGYDKLLSRHISDILGWLAVNGFWLSLVAASVIGGAIALWINVFLQSRSDGALVSVPDPEWADFVGMTFHNEEVLLDYRRYIGCKFHNVTFVYNGGKVSMTRNEIHGFKIISRNKTINDSMVLLHELGAFRFQVVDNFGTVPRRNTDQEINQTHSGSGDNKVTY